MPTREITTISDQDSLKLQQSEAASRILEEAKQVEESPETLEAWRKKAEDVVTLTVLTEKTGQINISDATCIYTVSIFFT